MSKTIKFRLLATTDLHAHLLRYDYIADAATGDFGLEGLVDAIHVAKEGCDAVMLVDNGDLLQGSLIGDLARAAAQSHTNPEAPTDYQPHPMIEALNLLGYCAATPGNHDFNYGLCYLSHAIRHSNFAWVNANITDIATSQPPAGLKRHILHEIDLSHIGAPPLRVGVTGAAPPQILNWDAQLYAGVLDIENSQTALKREAHALRQQGADLAIALCHFGLSDAQGDPNGENPGRALARTGAFDGLVLGHTHQVFPNSDEGDLETPAVMAGYYGSHLGVLDYDLIHDGTTWQVSTCTAHLIAAAPPSSAHFSESTLITTAHERATAVAKRAICPNDTAPQAHFTELGYDDLWPIVAQSHMEWGLAQEALANRPILVALAPMHITRFRQQFANASLSGPIVQERHVHQLLPYPNTLAVIGMTGAQIIRYLERAASYFAPIETGILSAQQPAYNFDALFGLSYDINISAAPRYDGLGRVSAPDAHRIENVMYHGRPLDLEQPFWIITNHHRAGGGGHFPHTGPHTTFDLQTEMPSARDVLHSYLTQFGLWAPSRYLPFRLTCDTDQRIEVRITDEAADQLHQIAHMAPRLINNDELLPNSTLIEVTLPRSG